MSRENRWIGGVLIDLNDTETLERPAGSPQRRFFSVPDKASLVFICKRLKLNYRKLSEEEKKLRKKIAEKSGLLKNPISVNRKIINTICGNAK